MFKYHSDGSVVVISKKKKNYFLFFEFSLFWKNGHGLGEKGGYFQLGMGQKFDP